MPKSHKRSSSDQYNAASKKYCPGDNHTYATAWTSYEAPARLSSEVPLDTQDRTIPPQSQSAEGAQSQGASSSSNAHGGSAHPAVQGPYREISIPNDPGGRIVIINNNNGGNTVIFSGNNIGAEFVNRSVDIDSAGPSGILNDVAGIAPANPIALAEMQQMLNEIHNLSAELGGMDI